MTDSFLSPASIERLRRVNRRALKDLALVERPGEAGTAYGGANTGSRTFTAVGNTDTQPAPCLITPLGAGALPTEADQTVALNRWLLTLDLAGPAVGPGYRVTVSGFDNLGQPYTRRLIVLGEHNPRTHAAMRRYTCEDAGPGRR